MMHLMRTRILAALSVVALVSACGNQPESQSTRSLIKGLFDLAKASRGAPPQQAITADVLAKVLAATPNSVMLFTLENTKAQVPIIQIESNLAYRTYATGGRQSVTVKNGFVTATRGLGGDLMSADLDQSLNLISQRQSGQTKRVMRYLTGEDVTFEYKFDCVVSTTGAQGGFQGMREDCRAGKTTIVNTYAVNNKGQIMASRQWLGPIPGYASLALLRD